MHSSTSIHAAHLRPMTHFDAQQADIDLLNAFLCRERSAREAYGVLLEASSDEEIRRALARLRNSHQERINELEGRIRALGGIPRAQSSLWRTLLRAREQSAGRLNKGTVIFTLEDYSSRILRAYRRSLTDLSPESRKFIERKILPESQIVHQSVISLQKAL